MCCRCPREIFRSSISRGLVRHEGLEILDRSSSVEITSPNSPRLIRRMQ